MHADLLPFGPAKPSLDALAHANSIMVFNDPLITRAHAGRDFHLTNDGPSLIRGLVRPHHVGLVLRS
jgi:hypothetical protein